MKNGKMLMQNRYGQLNRIDNISAGDPVDVYSDGNFIYVAGNAAGIISYSIDGSGNLTQIDTDDQGGTYRGVWSDGTVVFVACSGDGLRTYTVDGSGNLTYVEVHDQGGEYERVWSDGTFIYVAARTAGIHSYSCNASGNLTYIDTDKQGTGEYYGVWGDGTYVYVGGGLTGIISYTVDGAGLFTHVDTDFQVGSVEYKNIWSDGNYIFVTVGTSGIMSYSETSGIFTHKYTLDMGTAIDIWGDDEFLYIGGNSTSGLESYSIGSNGEFIRRRAYKFGATSMNCVHADNNYILVGNSGAGLISLSAIK